MRVVDGDIEDDFFFIPAHVPIIIKVYFSKYEYGNNFDKENEC